MSEHMKYFVLDLIINLAIVLVYLLWKAVAVFILKRKDAAKGVFIRTFVMLVCPLAGPFYFFISYVVYRVFLRSEKVLDLSDVIFGKDKVNNKEKADEARAHGIASMEETLAVSDRDSTREMLLNVLHGNIQETIGVMVQCLDSDDSETSHYAASILQAEIGKFRTHVSEAESRAEAAEAEEKAEIYANLSEYMITFLKKHLLNDIEHQSFVQKLQSIAAWLYENKPVLLEGEVCESLALMLMDMKELDRCSVWCERMKQLYPNMLGSYTVPLKLYYTTGNGEAFSKAMTDLRSADVNIDKETLDMIRAFTSA